MDTLVLVEVQSSLTLHQHQASLEKSNATELKHTSQEEEGQQVESAPPIVNGEVKGLKFTVLLLLDPCSTGSEGYIVDYIHPDAINKIEEHKKFLKKKLIKKCTCLRATTCTAAGCFKTSTCKTMYIRLFDDNDTLGEEKISFRVAKGIQHDIITGNHT